METEIHVRKLLPAWVHRVPQITAYFGPRGAEKTLPNPHLYVVCPTDEPGSQSRPYGIGNRFAGGKKLEVPPHTVVPFQKPGARKFRAVKKKTHFTVEVEADPIVNLAKHEAPGLNPGVPSEWIEGTGVDGRFKFRVFKADDQVGYGWMVRALSSERVSEDGWRIERASMASWQGSTFPRLTLSFPRLKNDTSRVNMESVLTNFIPPATEHSIWRVLDVAVKSGKLHIQLAGQPGDWLITDPFTLAETLAYGQDLPAGYARW